MSRKRRQDSEIVAPSPSSNGHRSHPPKRAKTYTEKDSQLAQIFDRLSHEVEKERFDAVRELLQVVSPEKSPEAPVVERIIRRLIRGLCSSRKAARLGFVIALSEVLRQTFDTKNETVLGLGLTVEQVVGLVVDSTKPDGDVGGQVSHPFERVTLRSSPLHLGETRPYVRTPLRSESYHPVRNPLAA
jgi:DNA polymerase phi